MKKKLLILRILITEQKVNFYESICRVYEKIERFLKKTIG